MYLLPRFEFHEPKDITEANLLLFELGTTAKIIAGGTDLLINMKKGVDAPRHLVSIAKIPELADIDHHDGTITIGSYLIVARLIEHDLIKNTVPLLSQGAAVLGSPLIRNRATIGGNIVTARPAADLPPQLMAMRAKVELQGHDGERHISLDDFFHGPGQTALKPTEILTRIIIDRPPPYTGGDYIKLGHRQACEICITAVTSRITLDKPDGIIKDASIVLSAVAQTIIHARAAEDILKGEKPTVALFERAAAQAAQKDAKPISDIRGSAEYRRAMVDVLVKRTLTTALHKAQGKS